MPFTNTKTHSFRSVHSESWHSTGQYAYRPDTFVNSPQQDVMILMTGSHHGGHVSQQEISQVKHVPSLLINSLVTCCHLTLLGTATHLLLVLFSHFALSIFLSLSVSHTHKHTHIHTFIHMGTSRQKASFTPLSLVRLLEKPYIIIQGDNREQKKTEEKNLVTHTTEHTLLTKCNCVQQSQVYAQLRSN